MQIRANKRIHVHQEVVIFYGDAISAATLNNCSEKGMYVESRGAFPLDTILKIIIPLDKDELLEVPAKVVRLTKIGEYEGMGVALLAVSLKYNDFLINRCLGY